MPFLSIVTLVLLAYALVDVVTTDSNLIRNLPKLIWLAVVVVPILGPLTWILAGRPRGGSLLPGTTAREYTAPRRDPGRDRGQPLPPDDDPEFLRRLGDPRNDR